MKEGNQKEAAQDRIAPGKLAFLLALYFVQGLPFGFQAKALPIYLRDQGVGLTEIGLVGALALPWMLKALWAPLVDRYGSSKFGRRKSWIVPMQAALAITCLAGAAAANSGHLNSLLLVIFLMNLFAATQDIAVDGLAVDILGEKELGPGNAAQVVGYKIGMLTGGGLLVWATKSIGWEGLFISMAALIVAVLVWAILYREVAADTRNNTREIVSMSELWVTLKRLARRRETGWVLATIATYKLGESMVDRMFVPFVLDLGIPPDTIGLWLGVYGMGASIAGSIAGGFLALRLPLLRALSITATLRVIPLVAQWLLTQTAPSDTAIIAVTMSEHFFGGALTTALFAFMMSRVDPRIGATHFTLLATVEVLGKSPGSLGSGILADAFGYGFVFGLGALLSAAFLLLLRPLASALDNSQNPTPVKHPHG